VTIIYGYDFSEASIEALPAAAAIASTLGTRLTVVHVADPKLRTLSSELERALDAATKQKLESMRVELDREFPRLDLRMVQLLGHPLDELQAFAMREDSPLLVVASGGSADPRERIGSISERLALRSEVPVLVIRDPAPWLAWSRGERSLRAVLGASRDASCTAAVEMTTRLRGAAPCDVVVTEVYFAPELAAHYGFRPSDGSLPDPELEQLVTRDLGKRVSKLGGKGDLRLRPSLALGRPTEPLLDIAERERADVVIVGRHPFPGPFGLGSVSKGVLHNGRISVLIVPAGVRSSQAAYAPRFDHLLAATDLTRFGNQVIPHALSLAAAAEAELTLLHVADPQALDHEDPGAVVAKLRRLVPERWPHPVWTEVVSSREPSTAIAAAAERIDADAICVASHGRTGLARAALGSVSEALIRLTHRPVLVVRPAEE
jgi:nucleotide-binding universal stress UspA family protein